MEQWKKYPNDLFSAKSVSCEQQTLELDPTIKQVYLHMFCRYVFFSGKDGSGAYFENQDVIADSCAVSRHTVLRVVAKLTKVGLLEVKKKRLKNGAVSNSYVVHEVDGVSWWYDDNRKSPPPPPKREAITPRWDEECPF